MRAAPACVFGFGILLAGAAARAEEPLFLPLAPPASETMWMPEGRALAASTFTVALAPAADTTVKPNDPNANYGTQNKLTAGKPQPGRSLLRFSNAEIQQAIGDGV